MNLLATLLAYFHCSKFRNSRVIKWLVGDEEPQAGSCACKGTWDKYLNAEHGKKYCSRSSHRTVTVHEL
jgi:hypothetical protein